jgi:uncharacterized protein (TIGR02996 family)
VASVKSVVDLRTTDVTLTSRSLSIPAIKVGSRIVTQEQDLLQAIIQNPDEDAPRLSYADWLQDTGQHTRADFIRVQCALAAGPEDDDLRADLEGREWRLGRHCREWLGPLANLIASPGRGLEYSFRRGFVESVSVRARTLLQNGERLLGLSPIREICLVAARGHVEKLAACPHLARLRGLGFWFTPIGLRSFQALLASPYSSNLGALELTGSIGPVGLSALLESPLLPQLTRLDYSDRLDAQSAERLATCSSIANLTRLNVGNQAIGIEGARAIAMSPYLAGLTELGLGFTYIGEELGSVLAASPFRLQSLFLSESNLGDAGLEAIAACPHFSGLRELYIDDDYITTRGALALASSPFLTRLRTLWIYDNPIGDAGARLLAESPGLSGLTDLRIFGCGLRDEGVFSLAASPTLSRLVKLDLRRTYQESDSTISDEGARALAASPYLNRLAYLNLAGNPIGTETRRLVVHRFGSDACMFR